MTESALFYSPEGCSSTFLGTYTSKRKALEACRLHRRKGEGTLEQDWETMKAAGYSHLAPPPLSEKFDWLSYGDGCYVLQELQ